MMGERRLAPVARGRFSFSVKWLALRAGQR